MNRAHSQNRRLRIYLAIGVAAGCVACAFNGAKDDGKYEKRMQRAVDALVADGDADSLAAASMFAGLPRGNPMLRLELIRRATVLAPDRADLTWLELQSCSQVASCDPLPIEALLRALDPTNAVPWSVSIRRSVELNDSGAVRKNLEQIARSQRFDIYWNTTIVHAVNAAVKDHLLDTQTAIVATIGATAAWSIPPYQQILKACNGAALQDPAVLQTCREVASVLRRGDTYITEMVGIAIAKRTWPEGSPERKAAVDARRVAYYRMQSAADIAVAEFRDKNHSAQYLQLLATHKTEQEVVLAELLTAGLSPTPPPDWKDHMEGGS